MRYPRALQVATPGWSPVLPKVGSSPVFAEEDGAGTVLADAEEVLVSLRASTSASVVLAALARILAAAAIGGSSCKEYF